MRFVVKAIIIGGVLPGFLGASCSGSAFFAPADSVSVSVVLRGAKKLRVNTTFRGSLTTAVVGTGLVDFLAVCERYVSTVSLGPGSRHPGPFIPLRFFFHCAIFSACALIFKTAFSSFSVTMYIPKGALKNGLPCTALQNFLCSPPHYSQ
jgi:hypothetical protein